MASLTAFCFVLVVMAHHVYSTTIDDDCSQLCSSHNYKCNSLLLLWPKFLIPILPFLLHPECVDDLRIHIKVLSFIYGSFWYYFWRSIEFWIHFLLALFLLSLLDRSFLWHIVSNGFTDIRHIVFVVIDSFMANNIISPRIVPLHETKHIVVCNEWVTDVDRLALHRTFAPLIWTTLSLFQHQSTRRDKGLSWEDAEAIEWEEYWANERLIESERYSSS